MATNAPETRLRQRLTDQLYTEALLLADEARGYFETSGRAERDALPQLARVALSCESLKVTTRLMHVIAWLLTQRAVLAGELCARNALDPSRRLGDAPVSGGQQLLALPVDAVALVRVSEDLHRRATWLDDAQTAAAPPMSLVRSMQDRLTTTFYREAR